MVMRTFAIIALFSLSACAPLASVFQWGEAPPPPLAAKMAPSNSESTAPDPLLVFSGSEKESVETLDYWTKETHNIWSVVRGEKRNQLSESEIASLIHNRVLDLPGDKKTWVKQIIAVKRLLGFPGSVSKEALEDWFKWINCYREELRTVYQRIDNGTIFHQKAWNWSVLRSFLTIAAELFDRGVAPVSSQELSELLEPLLTKEPERWKSVSFELVHVSLNLISSFCGIEMKTPRWEGRKVSLCLSEAVAHFSPIGAWVDFQFGALNPLQDLSRLEKASIKVKDTFTSWFDSHPGTPIYPLRLTRLTDRLGFRDFTSALGSFNWIAKLDPDSSATQISPRILIRVAETFAGADLGLIHALKDPGFELDKNCDKTEWKRCRYEGDFPDAKLVAKIRKNGFGNQIYQEDLEMLSRIRLYAELSRVSFEIFDTKLPLGLDHTETLTLAQSVISVLDVKAYVEDLTRVLQGGEMKDTSLSTSLAPTEIKGFVDLLLLVTDLYPKRDAKDGLLPYETFASREGKRESPRSLDQLGLISAVYLAFALPDLRDNYYASVPKGNLANEPLIRVQGEGEDLWTPRESVIRSLPHLLADYFPRLYKACRRSGFAKSCGVVFSEILPSDSEKEMIYDFEIDTITISSIFIESIVDRCDWSKNRKFSRNGITNKTELECVYFVTRELYMGLVKSKLIPPSETMTKIYDITDNLPPARWVGEVAIVRGTSQGVWLQGTLFSSLHRNATLGSFMSFAAEAMDDEKTHAIQNRRAFLKLDEPGDELIYGDGYGNID